jgi:hypothetical protein
MSEILPKNLDPHEQTVMTGAKKVQRFLKYSKPVVALMCRRGRWSANNDPRDNLSRRERAPRDVHPRETSRSSVVAI